MLTACEKCGKSYRHEVYDPPRQYIGAFYAYDALDTTPAESIEIRYDVNGKPYPHFVEKAMPTLIIKEDWIKDCDCRPVSYDDEYCSHCSHCHPEDNE